MNEKQVKALIAQLKQQFKAKFRNKTDKEIDEMILDMFFGAFCEDKMSREDLTALTMAMGHEVKDDVLDEVEREKSRRQ